MPGNLILAAQAGEADRRLNFDYAMGCKKLKTWFLTFRLEQYAYNLLSRVKSSRRVLRTG